MLGGGGAGRGKQSLPTGQPPLRDGRDGRCLWSEGCGVHAPGSPPCWPEHAPPGCLPGRGCSPEGPSGHSPADTTSWVTLGASLSLPEPSPVPAEAP